MREDDVPDLGEASEVVGIPPAVAWDCDVRGHLWHSTIVVRSRVTVSDWCVNCTEPRPGYIDPKEL